MKRLRPLLLGVLVAVWIGLEVTFLVLLLSLSDRPPDPPDRSIASEGAKDLPVPSDQGKSRPIPAGPWVRRFGDQFLFLGREGGLSVEERDPEGRVLCSGRLDATGVLRATAKGDGASRDAVEILLDRDIAYPGDRMHICVRAGGPLASAKPLARLHFEPAEPGIGSVDFRAMGSNTSEDPPPPGPRWQFLHAEVPGDIRPGKAVVVCGPERREIPVVARFDRTGGEADGPSVGAFDDPKSPPSASGLALECRAGVWHAKAPDDATTILFFAESCGRLLAHEGVLALDGAASAALPLADSPPPGARVTAVAATPRGFVEATRDVPGVRGVEEKDPVLARFISFRPRPELPGAEIEIRDGDEFTGPSWPRPGPVASLEMPVGKACTLFSSGREAVPGSEVRWSVHPPGAEGALRIRAADGILLETRVDRDHSSGAIPASDIGDRALLVESDAPGLKTIRFRWDPVPPKGPPAPEPARPGEILSVERRFPSEGRAGDEVEYYIVIHSKARGALTVRCPIPAAAVPAEEGWQVRARAPAGTRVRLDWMRATFEIPAAGPGDVVLTLRLRLERAGKVAVPAVEVEGRGFPEGDPRQDSASTASGTLIVE